MLDQTGICLYAGLKNMLVFFDMCAPFDKLRHDKILQRMIDCNFNPNFFNWCNSYLSERTTRVKVSCHGCIHYGDLQVCPSSVPQGSVVWPWLFWMFMGSLSLEDENRHESHLVIYADDILLIERISTPIEKHKSNVCTIQRWCDQSDLQLNPEKTVQMFIQKKKTFLHQKTMKISRHETQENI